VLCRIYKKINKAAVAGDHPQRSMECEDSVEDAVAAYPPYATAGMAGGSNYGSLLHHHDSHEDNFLHGLLTADQDAGLSAGATSLSHLAAAARTSPATTKQLLAPSSSTPFNWLDASTVGMLPQARNFPGFSRGRNVGSMSLSSTADMAGAGTCVVDNGVGGGNAVNTMSAFMSPLTVQDGAYHQQHVILGTSMPPEASAAAASAFQNPVQISGVNWNP
jgi:hypothetical protein